MVKSNKISVIIPMYNAADTIERCLNSVLRQMAKGANADAENNCKALEKGVDQTRNSQNFSVEIIVVDDGSTDDCAQIVKTIKARTDCGTYAKSEACTQVEFDPNLVALSILGQQNAGPSAARNTGLKNATGDWIYFLDSDDEIVEGCFARLMQVAHDFCAKKKCLPDMIVPRAVAILEDEIVDTLDSSDSASTDTDTLDSTDSASTEDDDSDAANIASSNNGAFDATDRASINIDTTVEADTASNTFSQNNFSNPPKFLVHKLEIGKFVADTIQDEDWKFRFPLFYSSGKLIRAEMLKSCGVVYDETVSHAEDAKFSAGLLPYVNSVVVIDQPLYKYYVRTNSLSKGRRDAAEVCKAGLDFEKSVISTLRGWGVYGDIPEINNHAIKLAEIVLIDYIRQAEIDYAEVRANMRQLFGDADFCQVAARSCPTSSADKVIKRIILHKNVGLCAAFIKLCRNTGMLRG